MTSIRVAIVGVGNCASSLVQGVHFYRDADPSSTVPGLMHVQFGDYHVSSLEFVAAFDDRPEVQAFQTYLSSADWANEKAKATPNGGWVSANKGLDINNLVSPMDQLSASTLQDEAAVFRFDGSDMMPAKVGAGTFWKGMTDWITGQSTQDTLDFIESSWPS